MTTYFYETMPQKHGEKPRYFELKPSVKNAPFTHGPETGEPIRRVVPGGFGTLSSKNGAHSGSACGCAPGGCGG